MKTRLLRKLRRKFYIRYFPGRGKYRVNCKRNFFDCDNLILAKDIQRIDILKEGRDKYEKYGKKLKIKP